MYGEDRTLPWVNRIDFAGMVSFLRGAHPTKTAEHVAGMTGISAKTVAKWLDGAEPGSRHFLTLALVYGPQFVSACVRGAPAWLDEAHRNAERESLRREIAEREARLAELGEK